MNLKKFITHRVLPAIAILKIPSVTRLSMDEQLRKQFLRLQYDGIVLNVGSKDSPYNLGKTSFD